MTRINLVDPSILTRRHLVAEYKELTQIIHPMKVSSSKYKLSEISIPSEFCLNKGHVKFFYNKGLYLIKRYMALNAECIRRGINVDQDNYKHHLSRLENDFPLLWRNDYSPNKNAYKIVIDRIIERINSKPHLYPDQHVFLEKSVDYI